MNKKRNFSLNLIFQLFSIFILLVIFSTCNNDPVNPQSGNQNSDTGNYNENSGDPLLINYFNYHPNNINLVNLASEEKEISVIARDIAGVGVCDIPVLFRLIGENNSEPNGVLNLSFSNTCFDSSTYGISTIKYQNIGGGIDNLIAEILNPNANQFVLFSDTIRIETVGSSLLIDDVAQLNCNATKSFLTMSSLDSIKTDTIFARALDENNSLIPGIPFEFDINEEFYNSAFLTAGGAISDSTGIAYTILNVHPNIFSNNLDSISLNINIQVPSTQISNTVNVIAINQIPSWYDFSAELVLNTNTSILPCLDESCPDETSAIITASLQDSLLNPPPSGTVIEFSSFRKDTLQTGDGTETIWEPIGNITPGSVFDEYGIAQATFNMVDDRGIAYIIGTVGNFSDTIQIIIESTNASHIQIIPPEQDEIMVQGGGGIEYSEVWVHLTDNYGNLVYDEEYKVHFQISEPAPIGISLGQDGNLEVTKTSDFGTTSITIVSGTAPGSVHLTVKLFNINDDVTLDTPIAIAESIPLTVVTGPPEYGELNFSYSEIIPIGGGLYEFLASVYLEDLYSNPIADSTSIYFKIRELAATYDINSDYGYEDIVTWLSPDSSITTELDSLVYICINQLEGCIAGIEPYNISNWDVSAPPAQIIGEGETGMPNPSTGDSYPGIAWTKLYFGSFSIASEIIVFAQTYSTDNSLFILDSRENHNGDGIELPCYDCQISLFALPTEWDFSLDPFDPDVETDFQDVLVQATVTDYYQFPVFNALLALDAPQVNFTFVCNGEDTDLDGSTGSCVNAINENDILALVDSCWECGDYAPDYIWIIEDTDGNDIADVDGTMLLIPDDIPNYSRTNSSGIGLWNIRYAESVCIPQGTDPTTYQTFNTTLTVSLLTSSTNNPTATTTLIISKSEED